MSEMIERLCRKMCELDQVDPDEDWTLVPQPNGGVVRLDIALRRGERQQWRTYIWKVKALLKVAREPTEAMVRAGDDYERSGAPASLCYPVMIDAALEAQKAPAAA